MTDVLVFAAMSALWCLSELWIGLRHRAADRSRDDGTLVRLVLVVGGGMVVAMLVSIWLPGRLPPAWQPTLLWGGCALMLAGMLLRWWSIRVLAGFFTVDVTIAADHRLIRSGPFRWVRDPSYTGRLLTVLGLSVCARQLAGAAGRRGPDLAGLASAHPPRSRSSIRPMRARRGVCCRACGDVASGRRGRPTRAVTPRPGVKLSRPAHSPFA